MNSSGLRTDPWCTPTLTLKALLSLHSTSPCCRILIHRFYHRHYPLIHTHISQCPPNHLPRHPINAFSRSTKAIHSSIFFAKYFSCSWRTIKIASVVLLPAIKPNCMLSIFTIFLTLVSITLSSTFIACSSSLMPLYEPHAKASPFPL